MGLLVNIIEINFKKYILNIIVLVSKKTIKETLPYTCIAQFAHNYYRLCTKDPGIPLSFKINETYTG